MSEIRFVDVAMRFKTRRGEVRALERISLTVPDDRLEEGLERVRTALAR